MSLEFFSPKDPSETNRVLTINFATTPPILETGETIVSATWAITLEDGTAQTSYTTVGSADVTATPLVKQTVTGGTANTTYMHRALVTTSLGRIVVGAGLQRVTLGAI